MEIEKTVKINTTLIKESIESLQIPRWWLAQSIGVHRRTLGRWLSGEVTYIKQSNAEALAKCLGVSTARILVQEDLVRTPTNALRRRAGQFINSAVVAKMFAKNHRWREYTTLAESTLHEHLSAEDLCRTYLNIGFFAMQHLKLTESEKYLAYAKSLATDTADPWIQIQSALFSSQLYLKSGGLSEARKSVGEGIALSRRYHSSLLTKAEVLQAEYLYQFGDLGAAIAGFSKILQGLDVKSERLKRHQILIRRAVCHIDRNDMKSAIADFKESSNQALAANYPNGAANTELMLASAMCRIGDLHGASKSEKKAVRLHDNKDCVFFQENRVEYEFCRALEGRHYHKARQHLQAKIKHYRSLPFYRAMTHMSYARLSHLLRDGPGKRRHRKIAVDLFSSIGAAKRLAWATKVNDSLSN